MDYSGRVRQSTILIITSLVLVFILAVFPAGGSRSKAATGLEKHASAPANGWSAAPGAPDATFADRFGVADSHLPLYLPQNMDKTLDGIRDAGGRWVRCVFAWTDMEYIPGNWVFAGADTAISKAQDRGIKVLGILGFPPWWANGGNPPNYPPSPAFISNWENYVKKVCSLYKGKVAAWEIWNEENIDPFWEPPDSETYMWLVSHTSSIIRSADPDATIVMGGVAGLGSDFLHECLDAGIADYVDALAYHPYVETISGGILPNESLCRNIVNLVRTYISMHTDKHLEIWLTELGWPTEPNPVSPGVDEHTQACYLLRTFINYADTEVNRVIWYSICDEPDMAYGLLRSDWSAKPSLAYYRVFQDVFGAATSSAPDAATYSCSNPATLEAHCFNLPDGTLAMAVWKSDDSNDSVTLTTSGTTYAKPVTIDPATGAQQPTPNATRGADGKVTVSDLPVGKQPVILKFHPQPTVSAIKPATGVNTTTYAVEILGSNFQAGASVRLQKGATVINGTGVVLAGEGKLTCNLNLSGKPLGKYDVFVTNTDGGEGKLTGGFTVVDVCGQGAGLTISVFAGLLGLLSAAGLGWRRKRR